MSIEPYDIDKIKHAIAGLSFWMCICTAYLGIAIVGAAKIIASAVTL